MSRGAGRRDRIQATVGYYRAVAPHIERELTDRPDRDFWDRVGEEHSSASVLELGCGTGRVTGYLAPRVRRVVALDLSPDMIRRARRRFAPGGPVHLLRADVLDVPLRRAFDVAVAANGVFSHLIRDEQRLRALRQLRRCLRPGGVVVMDAFWLSRRQQSRRSAPDGASRTRVVPGDHGPLRISETWICDPDTARCRVRYRYRRPDGSTSDAETVLRHWTGPEVRRLFPEAGLRLTATWGDYDRSGWSPDSRRLVIRARRPG